MSEFPFQPFMGCAEDILLSASSYTDSDVIPVNTNAINNHGGRILAECDENQNISYNDIGSEQLRFYDEDGNDILTQGIFQSQIEV